MIDGIAISGYRSFGAELVTIPDLGKVNIFIGRNNCGKSNILRFVILLSEFLKHQGAPKNQPELDTMLDFCMNSSLKEVRFGVQVKKEGYTKDTFKTIAMHVGNQWEVAFTESWFDFKLNKAREPDDRSINRLKTVLLDKFKPEILSNSLSQFRSSYSANVDTNAEELSKAIHKAVRLKFEVHMVDAFRRITDTGGDPLSGAGLIQELRKLQQPVIENYDPCKARFSQIVEFLRSILGEPTAELDIPAEKDEIYVKLGGKMLPLESLGTGIHELIIIAAAVTLVDGVVFCIEEPEIHLHPELQKKFVEYITKNTDNQYLIASHSNAFFDLPGVNIYRCWLEEGITKCALVSEAKDKHVLLRDLGYRPSDLLQANYVIWVEGPSDRVYLKHWIKAKDPSLIEGLHYTIMFYGGRLLAHLSYDDPEVDDFVRLSRLNRSACIMMDSDVAKNYGRINKTKNRVKNDFEKNSCLVWITKGRTIENYIPEDNLNQAIKKVHPKTKRHIKWAKYEDVTRLRKDKIINKVAVARVVVEFKADFSMLDLDAAMNGLINEIRKHN